MSRDRSFKDQVIPVPSVDRDFQLQRIFETTIAK
jgi:hypothetical protein